MAAFGAEGLDRISQFGVLECSSMAWAFYHLMVRHEPVCEAVQARYLQSMQVDSIIPACSQGQLPEEGPKGSYSMAWSMWRASDSEVAHALLRNGHPTLSVGPEVPVCGLEMMEAEWSRSVKLQCEVVEALNICARS